jgi:hypothetical protein
MICEKTAKKTLPELGFMLEPIYPPSQKTTGLPVDEWTNDYYATA